MKKIAFLDRDGTLIFEPLATQQVDDPGLVQILDGVEEGLLRLKNLGFELMIVTNQNGVGTPSFPREKYEAAQNYMLELFSGKGIFFDEVFMCPHFPEDNCECRKPKIGLVKEFMKKNEIDKQNEIDFPASFMCGDRDTDRQFAENIGVRFIPMETNGNFPNIPI